MTVDIGNILAGAAILILFGTAALVLYKWAMVNHRLSETISYYKIGRVYQLAKNKGINLKETMLEEVHLRVAKDEVLKEYPEEDVSSQLSEELKEAVLEPKVKKKR